MSEGSGAWPPDLFRAPLVQPDQRTCGAAALVVARMLLDPAYRPFAATPESFRSEVLAMHRRVTSAVDVRGRMQVPWPRAFGTPPWAVARQLDATSGVEHDVRPLLSGRDPAYDSIAAATAARQPVPVYVGNRWLPRHVVLAVAEADGVLRCYEPVSGRLVGVTRRSFVDGTFALAGWDRPWCAVLPAVSGARPPARRTPA